MNDLLPNELPKTWLWRLKKLCMPTKQFSELVNMPLSTLYAIANCSINASVDKVTQIETALRELERQEDSKCQ